MKFFYISELQQLAKELADGPKTAQGPLSLTIGNFDGIHLGHQELLKASLKWSQQHQGHSVLLTFHPHPVEVLNPSYHHSRIFPLSDQQQELQKMGFRGIFVQDFSPQFRELSAEAFLQDFVGKGFHPQHLVVGHDFGFGKNRSGNLELLRKFCAEQKIELVVVPALRLDGEIISTSAIRAALAKGEMQHVKRLLGRVYFLKGVVVHGEHRGASIGFPTANLQITLSTVSLKRGVYATRSIINGQSYASVTNIGVNPTVSSDQQLKIETHIFDFDRPLYGQDMQVEFWQFLREEKKFSSFEELKKQIQEDAVKARECFS